MSSFWDAIQEAAIEHVSFRLISRYYCCWCSQFNIIIVLQLLFYLILFKIKELLLLAFLVQIVLFDILTCFISLINFSQTFFWLINTSSWSSFPFANLIKQTGEKKAHYKWCETMPSIIATFNASYNWNGLNRVDGFVCLPTCLWNNFENLVKCGETGTHCASRPLYSILKWSIVKPQIYFLLSNCCKKRDAAQ